MFGLKRKNGDNQIEVTISNQTVLRILLLVLGAVVFLAAVKQASHALVLIFTAFFLALALNGPVHWLSQHLPKRKKNNRTLATSISFIVVILFLTLFLASIVPPLVRQTSNFLDNAPGLVKDLRSEDSSLGRFVRSNNLEDELDKYSNQLSDRLSNIGGSALSGITKISSSLISLLTILVLTFMMLIEGPRWIGFAQRLLPNEKRKHTNDLARDMYRVVKGYVNGQVILAALAAVLIVVPLFILDVSYPIALMVIVFVCGLIPLVGHTIGAIIVSTVALFQSPLTALIVLAYYILYQQIENYVIQPRVQANSTNMSPLLVFASVIIGVNFGGLLGGLVAIPVAGCLRILVLDYLENRNLLSNREVKEETTPRN